MSDYEGSFEMGMREGHIPPRIRIQKIILDNFKSIRHGEVSLNGGRNEVPDDIGADILGIYGQNGSGKTSVIEAIAILKKAMMGERIPNRYSECISKDSSFAKLSFEFSLLYNWWTDSSYTRTVTYSFKIESANDDREENRYGIHINTTLYHTKVILFDESISASGTFANGVQKKQDIITTTGKNYPIGPVRKIQSFVGKDKDAVNIELEVLKRTAHDNSTSFLFMYDTRKLFFLHADYSEYYQILLELHNYACVYLLAIDFRSSGIGATFSLPLNTRHRTLPVKLFERTKISGEMYESLTKFVKSINTVLPSIIPDMALVLNYNLYESGEITGYEVELLSKRGDTLIPLRDESAGVIKLICTLSLIIEVFNESYVTVAIDELDAGIFEYLLGEILSGIDTYGKGQFIFTSHNLRPLEVLKKESIIFTTSNPNNRFIRLKGVGRTNNLRDLYFREILGNSQDEQIYDAAKRQRMIAAFMKAGVDLD